MLESKRRKLTPEERQEIAEEMSKYTFEESIDFLERLGPSKKPRNDNPVKKLSNYHILVGASVFWESREAYLDLLQSFLLKEIHGETFSSKFFRLRGENMAKTDKVCERIENNIQPISDLYYTSKADDFSSIIDALFLDIDRYKSDIQDSDWNELVYSESKLRSVIQERYLPRLKKLGDLADSFFQPKIDLDQLIERSYQILFLVSLAASSVLLVNFF